MTDHGVGTIKFVDRTFNADRARALNIWSYCARMTGDTKYHFEIAADLLDEPALKLLESVPKGRFQFEIGVQTLNPQTLAAVSRSVDLDRLCSNVKRLRDADNIHLHLDLIAGLPFEDLASFRNSFNSVWQLRPHALQLGFLKLLRGTELRDTAEKHGLVFCAFEPYEVLSTPDISFEQLIKLHVIADLVERFHNSGRFESSLPLVIQSFDTPFDFFERFSVQWSDKGLAAGGMHRLKLYEFIHSFAESYLSGDRMHKFTEALRMDFTRWHNSGKGVPEWYSAGLE